MVRKSSGLPVRVRISGELLLDERTRELVDGNADSIAVQPKVFDLLVYLVQARDRVVPREELRRAIWPEINVGPDSITRALGEVRKLLGNRNLIRTYPSRGVRFLGDVTELESEPETKAAPLGLEPILRGIDGVVARTHTTRGALRIVIGPPGSGRTTLLRAIETRARTAGLDVIWSTDLCVAVEQAAVRKQPTIALHDDIHQSLVDCDASALVEVVVRRSVIVIATCCSSARRDPRMTPLLAAAARIDPEAIVTLRALDRAELQSLAETVLGRCASPAAITKLETMTGGNPRFAAHVLHIAKQIGRPLETIDRVPRMFCERLHDLVLSHLGRLGADARELLDAVSILDEPFTTAIAADIAELTPARTADALAEVATAGLVVHANGRWDFAQVLVRCVLERDLIPSRRAMLHARAAASLDRSLGTPPSHLDRIARHYVAGASVAHGPRALEVVRRAAQAAVDARTFDKASSWLYSALDLEASITPVDPTRRRELWLELAKTLLRDGQVERAGDAVAAAESLVDSRGSAIWAAFCAIAPVLPQVVEHFYALLFERHVGLRDMFSRPAPLQRRMFGEAIAALAEHAGDSAWLHEHLEALGRRHAEYGVTNEMYDWARRAFMDAISEALLPRRLPPDVRETWERTLDAITEAMKAAGSTVERITVQRQTREPFDRPRSSAR